jgi:sortase A
MRSEPTNSRGRLRLLWCSHTCMLSGALALAFYSYFWVDARVYQAVEGRRFDNSAPAASQCSTIETDAVLGTTGSSIGRISIPRLGVSIVVLEGDDGFTLRRGVGHIPGTAWPGQAGNLAIAGHRNTFFSGLRDIRKNDVIRVTASRGFYIYTVESIRVVGPEHIEVLDATERPTLTLVTCFPFSYIGPAPNRFIVRARQISSNIRADSQSCATGDGSVQRVVSTKGAGGAAKKGE